MSGRTAASMPHDKETPHSSEAHAQQRTTRTAKVFAVQFVHAHGKDGFAVEHFAGHSLP
jgi:phage terminase large subunit-like protein